jgi:hypothetical protein
MPAAASGRPANHRSAARPRRCATPISARRDFERRKQRSNDRARER